MDDLGTYRVTGREEMLGRENLIVDYINLAGQRVATLWLDLITGLPLRKRYYGNSQDDLRLISGYLTWRSIRESRAIDLTQNIHGRAHLHKM